MLNKITKSLRRITTHNWFYLFVGMLITVIIVVIANACVEDDVSAKDILPSLVTGIVSLGALCFGFLNNKEQQRIMEQQQSVQMRTTVQKEWVEKVRTYLSEIVDYYIQMDSIIQKSENANRNKPIAQQENFSVRQDYNLNLNGFRKNHILISLYLNFNEPLEKNLKNSIMKLWEKAILNRDRINATDDIDEIQNTAHILFENKLKSKVA